MYQSSCSGPAPGGGPGTESSSALMTAPCDGWCGIRRGRCSHGCQPVFTQPTGIQAAGRRAPAAPQPPRNALASTHAPAKNINTFSSSSSCRSFQVSCRQLLREWRGRHRGGCARLSTGTTHWPPEWMAACVHKHAGPRIPLQHPHSQVGVGQAAHLLRKEALPGRGRRRRRGPAARAVHRAQEAFLQHLVLRLLPSGQPVLVAPAAPAAGCWRRQDASAVLPVAACKARRRRRRRVWPARVLRKPNPSSGVGSCCLLSLVAGCERPQGRLRDGLPLLRATNVWLQHSQGARCTFRVVSFDHARARQSEK